MIFWAGFIFSFVLMCIYPNVDSGIIANILAYSFLAWVFWKIFGGLITKVFNMLHQKKKVKPLAEQPVDLSQIDYMDGHAFEHWCANLLTRLDYENVYVTPGSGDQGVDIVAVKDGIRHAFQCKRYSSRVGNKPVQEVYAGMEMYNCSVGTVITNQHFTDGAIELARRTGVHLWDRHTLETLVSRIDIPSKPFTDEEIEYYKSLPGVDKLEDMEDYEYLWFANRNVLDLDVLGWDEILCLVSRVFENISHAENLAKAVEKHFYAKTKVRPCESGHYVYVEVRVRSIRSNFEEDHFVVPTWA